MTEAQTLAALLVTIQLICSFYLPTSSRRSRSRMLYGTLVRAGMLGIGLFASSLFPGKLPPCLPPGFAFRLSVTGG